MADECPFAVLIVVGAIIPAWFYDLATNRARRGSQRAFKVPALFPEAITQDKVTHQADGVGETRGLRGVGVFAGLDRWAIQDPVPNRPHEGAWTVHAHIYVSNRSVVAQSLVPGFVILPIARMGVQ